MKNIKSQEQIKNGKIVIEQLYKEAKTYGKENNGVHEAYCLAIEDANEMLGLNLDLTEWEVE